MPSVSEIEIAGINFIRNIRKVGRKTIGDNHVALAFELLYIPYHAAVEKRIFFKRRFVYDDLYALCLDSLHHALNGRLTEVVAVCLHRKAVNPDDFRLAGDNLIGDKVFTRRIGVYDSRYKVLRHVRIVGAKLLCVFGQAVAAVPERRVVIVIAYSRVERYALYDRLRVETFKFGVGIEFVEIGDPQREIGVGEKFNRLRLGKRGIRVACLCSL